MTTQEGFNHKATLKRGFCTMGRTQSCFWTFKSNLRNALGGYKETLLRRLDGVMKRPEPPGERANNNGKVTVYNNTNKELYSVLLFATTGPPQTIVKLLEGVGEEGLGDTMAAWLALEERYSAATKELRRTREADNQNVQEGRRSARFLLRDGPLVDSPGTCG